jgi:hypothetical protein
MAYRLQKADDSRSDPCLEQSFVHINRSQGATTAIRE